MITAQSTSLRVLFLGLGSPFSLAPLRALLHAGITVVAVLMPDRQRAARAGEALLPLQPAPPSLIPLVNPYLQPTIVTTAWEHNVPAWSVTSLHTPALTTLIEQLRPDVGVVACCPWRLPPELLAGPTYGWVNLHPSMLPHYRGPAPVFWSLHDGINPTGVTLHQMDPEFDTGPILTQAPLLLPDGSTGARIDQLAGELGGRLLVPSLLSLAAGTSKLRPQGASGSSAPWPTADDFMIEPTWSAQHAFNFMCGTDEWQMPYLINHDSAHLKLHTALAYHPERTLGKPFEQQGSTLELQCNPGTLVATIFRT